MSRRKIRLVVGLGILVVLGGVGIGLVKVLKEGKRSQDPLERGFRAEAKGELDTAAELYRGLLATKPDHPQAFGALARVLTKQGKLDELDRVANERCEAAPELRDGWFTRVQVGVMTGRFSEAVALARTRVPQDPQLLQLTLWRVQDLSDDPRRRLAAVDAALRFADLAESPTSRALAELFATTTLFELADQLGEAQSANLVRAAVKMQADSVGRLTRSMQTDPSGAANLLLERFRLLDPWEQARRDAAGTIRLWLEAHEDEAASHEVRRDLATYHLREAKNAPAQEDAEDATLSREHHVDLARQLAAPLADAAPYALLRILRSFARAGAEREALQVLGQRQAKRASPIVELVRCRLLLQTGSEQPNAVADRAMKILEGAPDWRIAFAAHEIASSAGQPAEALAALEAYQRAHGGVNLAMALAARMARDQKSPGDALQFLEEHVEDVEQQGMLGPFLRILAESGPEQLLAFFEQRIQAGGDDESRYRLLRAWHVVSQISQSGATEGDRNRQIEAALADLRRCIELDAPASPELWAFVVRLAVTLKDGDLAGKAAARAIRHSDVALVRVLGLFHAIGRSPEEAQRRAFFDSLDKEVEGTDDAAWCRALAAAALESKVSPSQMLDALLSIAPVEDANERVLDLVAPLAVGTGRLELAERAARRSLSLKQDDVEGILALAHCLALARRHEELLDALSGTGVSDEKLSPALHSLAIGSLLALDRAAEAEERARRYFRANPRPVEAYVGLARTLIALEKRELALGVLNSAPQTAAVQLMRAEQQIELGRPDAAERICWAVCRGQPTNLRAWTTLSRILGEQQRSEELILPLTQVLEQESVRARPRVEGPLLVARGAAQERSGRAAAAIADYHRAIELGNRSLIALNNAAWLILKTDESQLAAAKRYVEMGLQLAPDQPNLNDTAAHVYLALGEHGKALECSRRALAPDARKWSYRLLLVRILDAKGDRPAARAELERILSEEPAEAAKQQARDQLRRWDAEAAPPPD